MKTKQKGERIVIKVSHVLSYAVVSALYWVWLDEELEGGMGVAAVMTVVTAVMTE